MSLTLAGDGEITGFDAAASGFGGLVAVSSVIKRDTFSASVAQGGTSPVTGLSVSHTLATATNKLIITVHLGLAAQHQDLGDVGMLVTDGGTPIGVASTGTNRKNISAGGRSGGSANTLIATSPSMTFVYEPGDTAAHTYAVNVHNQGTVGNVYVNHTENDSDDARTPRSISTLVIQEVSV